MHAIITGTIIGTAAGIWSYFSGVTKSPNRHRNKTSQRVLDGLLTGFMTGMSVTNGLDFAQDPDKNAANLTYSVLFGSLVVAHEFEIAE